MKGDTGFLFSVYKDPVDWTPATIFGTKRSMEIKASLWRNIEYVLTDALAKQIEAKTPYKIISDQDLSDTTMTGQITKVSQNMLMTDRDTGDDLEMELIVHALVTWKNLKTGDLLCDNLEVVASGTYSTPLGQNQGYASTLAANKLAAKIVELMENKW